MEVERNSAKVALMGSGWLASSILPNAYLRVVAIFLPTDLSLSSLGLPTEIVNDPAGLSRRTF